MTTTFARLVNKLAIRLNETEIPEGRFDDVIGIHAMMKEAVLDGIREVIHFTEKWPFLAVQQTMRLDNGTSEYAWPLDLDKVDWDSFQVIGDKQEGYHTRALRVEQREQWYEYERSHDQDSKPQGISIPDLVFPAHGRGFGVSPVPDKKYLLKFRYFKFPIMPKAGLDECPVPSKWDNVILACSQKHMYSFLDNMDRTNFWEEQFKRLMKEMMRVEIGNNYKYFFTGMNIRNSSRVFF